MPRLSEHLPNWPRGDWHDYYDNTIVRNPKDGEPCHVVNVGSNEDSPILKLHVLDPDYTGIRVQTVAASAFTWEHLKHPKVGWVIMKGLPLYVVRKPVRTKQKGFTIEKLEVHTIPQIGSLTDALLQKRADKRTVGISKMLLSDGGEWTASLYNAFFKRDRRLGYVKALEDVGSGGALAQTINEEALLLRSYLDDYEEYPYLVYYGLALAAKVKHGGEVNQVGNYQLGSILYDDAN